MLEPEETHDRIIDLESRVEGLQETLGTLINWQVQTLGQQGVDQLIKMMFHVEQDADLSDEVIDRMKLIKSDDTKLVDEIRYLPRDYEIAPFDAERIIALVRQSEWISDYAYKDIKEYESLIGIKVNDAFKIGWEMARLTNKQIGISPPEEQTNDK